MKYSEFIQECRAVFPDKLKFEPGEIEYLNSGKADGDIDLAENLLEWWDGGLHQVLSFSEMATIFASDTLFISLMQHYLAAMLFSEEDSRLSVDSQDLNNSHMYSFFARATCQGFCETLNPPQIQFLRKCVETYLASSNPHKVDGTCNRELLHRLESFEVGN